MSERNGKPGTNGGRDPRTRAAARLAKPDTRQDMQILRNAWSAIARSHALLEKPVYYVSIARKSRLVEKKPPRDSG